MQSILNTRYGNVLCLATIQFINYHDYANYKRQFTQRVTVQSWSKNETQSQLLLQVLYIFDNINITNILFKLYVS